MEKIQGSETHWHERNNSLHRLSPSNNKCPLHIEQCLGKHIQSGLTNKVLQLKTHSHSMCLRNNNHLRIMIKFMPRAIWDLTDLDWDNKSSRICDNIPNTHSVLLRTPHLQSYSISVTVYFFRTQETYWNHNMPSPDTCHQLQYHRCFH